MLTRRIAQTALSLPVQRHQVVFSARRVAGRRFASSSSTTGPIKKDGLNSMLVGAELLAGTVAIGYAIGWYSQRQKEQAPAPSSVKDVKDKAKSLVKKATSSDTPKAVASKAKEAVDKTKAVVSEKVQAVTNAVGSKSAPSDTPKALANKAKEAVDTTKAAVSEKTQAVKSSVENAVGSEAASSDTPEAIAKKAKEAVDTTKATVSEKAQAVKSSVAAAVRSSQSGESSPPHESGSGSRKPSSKDTESIVAAADSRSGGNEGSSSKTPAPSNHVEDSTAEEEDPQQAAFNPETGEINWDCPCLGGMAHGPCGEEFKDAFSCFVYSEEEPKGQDCIEKFRAMQDCFRKHPEVYGESEALDDDEVEYDIVSAVEAALDDTPANGKQ